MVTAIIFDCFGVVLTDALEGILRGVQKTDPDKAARIVAHVETASKSNGDALTYRSAVAAELGISHDEYMSRLRDGEVKNEALLAFIKELRSSYKLALLSNVSSGGLATRFAEGELAQYFDVVVASSDIGFAKPEPEAYEITADRLGVRYSECVMVDDREEYCQGARGVGMQSILYTSVAALKSDLERITA